MSISGKTKRILFVFHEACLTGATIVLFRYVTLLKAQSPHQLLFLLGSKGPLETELRELGAVYDWEEHRTPNTSFASRLLSRVTLLTGARKSYQDLLVEDLGHQNISLVYANTIVSSNIVSELKKRVAAPVIWHIHELELAMKSLGISSRELPFLPNVIVANSRATKRNLVANHAIREDKIVVHPPIIGEPVLGSRLDETHDTNLRVAIPETRFVVGSSGTAVTRKGAELFIVLAKTIEHVLPGNQFHFAWVGNTRGTIHEIEHDIERAGLAGKVTFTGEVTNPVPWFRRFDVFVSTSKEESFGLACVEAAYLGKPVMGFAGTEGLEEIIVGCHGILIPYMDVTEMAERLIQLAKNKKMREEMAASSRSFASGFTPDRLFNDWIGTLEKTMK